MHAALQRAVPPTLLYSSTKQDLIMPKPRPCCIRIKGWLHEYKSLWICASLCCQCAEGSCIVQEDFYAFWENIAALLLQPDLSHGLQPYVKQTMELLKAGERSRCNPGGPQVVISCQQTGLKMPKQADGTRQRMSDKSLKSLSRAG